MITYDLRIWMKRVFNIIVKYFNSLMCCLSPVDARDGTIYSAKMCTILMVHTFVNHISETWHSWWYDICYEGSIIVQQIDGTVRYLFKLEFFSKNVLKMDNMLIRSPIPHRLRIILQPHRFRTTTLTIIYTLWCFHIPRLEINFVTRRRNSLLQYENNDAGCVFYFVW